METGHRRILNRHLYSGRYRDFVNHYDAVTNEDRRFHDSVIASARQLANIPRDPSGLFGLESFLLKWMDIKAEGYTYSSERANRPIEDLGISS